MPWKGWENESRKSWGTELPPDKVVGPDLLKVGCLQRIADALEKLVDYLDPGRAARLEREAAASDLATRITLWVKRVCKPAQKALRGRFQEWLAPGNPTAGERADINSLADAVFVKAAGWRDLMDYAREPTDADRRAVLRAVDTLDLIAAFEARRGVVKRRVAAVLERARRSVLNNGTHGSQQ